MGGVDIDADADDGNNAASSSSIFFFVDGGGDDDVKAMAAIVPVVVVSTFFTFSFPFLFLLLLLLRVLLFLSLFVTTSFDVIGDSGSSYSSHNQHPKDHTEEDIVHHSVVVVAADAADHDVCLPFRREETSSE
mmetsp:Transcript_39231/g.45150  ORF Transcript_39231/g.45150 Transcript_39231/m.45150 type:complete len:133 (+) Transcript_39231:481-879(+)